MMAGDEVFTELTSLVSEEEEIMDGRVETTITMKIGEVRGLSSGQGGRTRDMYVAVTLDEEEVYRTTIIEKTVKPFSCLKFYVCDGDGVVRDPRIGHVTFTRDQLALLHEFTSEQWYPVYALTADTEVQGKIQVGVSIIEQLDGLSSSLILQIRVMEASGLSWNSCDSYCTVTLMSLEGELRSDIRKGLVHKKKFNPVYNETYRFPISGYEELSKLMVRISLWKPHLLGEDIFMGQIHLSLSSLDPYKAMSHEAWYTLCHRGNDIPDDSLKLGSIRLLISYHEDYILNISSYQPLITLLTDSLSLTNFSDGALSILHEVSRDRSAMGRCIVKVFLQIRKFEELAAKLISVEIESTSDPNTLFRGNSLTSKVIDEFMKVVGHSYLLHTLQPVIDEIFEVKRSCEVDSSRLNEGENLDVNMTNLLFFVERVLGAIVSSGQSCPAMMSRVFSLLRQTAIKKFPEHRDVVQFTSISGFVFLRFFAPAILNPKLFGLRPENPSPVVSRSLLLISKTIQNLGNVGGKGDGNQRTSLRKEDYMVPVLMELMDSQHMTAVHNYLDCIANDDSSSTRNDDYLVRGPHREGYLIKRALQRKKLSVPNFKKRYFSLSSQGLSYSKTKGDPVIYTIPLEDMVAVERVDETAFSMKFMLQVVQPERILYLQAKNSVDQMEWLSALAKVCYKHNDQAQDLIHSGAYLSNSYTCCGVQSADQGGCKRVSLAVKLLGGSGHDNDGGLERELNKIYRLLLEAQENLFTLKNASSQVTRSSGDVVKQEDTGLPKRLRTLCELIVFTKNIEVSTKCLLLKRPVRLGTKENPCTCKSYEAYLVR